MKLRDVQEKASNAIMDALQRHSSTLLVLPTGMGKTIVFAEIIKRFHPTKAIVVAHREELVNQAYRKITEHTMLNCGIERAEEKVDLRNNFFVKSPDVIVTSVQTQNSGGDGQGRMTKFNPMDYGLLILDECHHSVSESFMRMIQYYQYNPNLKILGVTATPDRSDNVALGKLYDSVAFKYELIDAINDGWLVPIKQRMVYINDMDLSIVESNSDDFNITQLSRELERNKVLYGMTYSALEIIGNEKTIIFAASKPQAEAINDIINKERPNNSVYVCDSTSDNERKVSIDRFMSGDARVLVNVGIATEGFDCPDVRYIVMARPTKSRLLYAQKIGRGTRPLAGIVDGPDTPELRKQAIAASAKPDCIVIDYVGNSGKHKLISTADILGGNYSPVAVRRAKKNAEESGETRNMVTDIEKEEAELKEEKRRKDLYDLRTKIQAKVKYTSIEVDPFNVWGMSPSRQQDKGKHKISDGLAVFLMKQGVNVDKITYHQAMQLRREIFRRFKKGLCSLKQSNLLCKFGYPNADYTRQQAKEMITQHIATKGWGRK